MVSRQRSNGDFSQPAKLHGSSQPTLQADALDEVHVFWLAGMSCDGCSVATVGASAPSAEALLTGNMPGLPKIILHHPVLSVEVGDEFMEPFHLAMKGELGKQFVVVYEGSIADERKNDENEALHPKCPAKIHLHSKNPFHLRIVHTSSCVSYSKTSRQVFYTDFQWQAVKMSL
jgi:Ni,Fe-hydrogenase I small subunit